MEAVDFVGTLFLGAGLGNGLFLLYLYFSGCR